MAGTPMMVSALVSAATMERPMPHHGMLLAAEKIIARVLLVPAEPHAQQDDAAQVTENDQPIGGVEIAVH